MSKTALDKNRQFAQNLIESLRKLLSQEIHVTAAQRSVLDTELTEAIDQVPHNHDLANLESSPNALFSYVYDTLVEYGYLQEHGPKNAPRISSVADLIDPYSEEPLQQSPLYHIWCLDCIPLIHHIGALAMSKPEESAPDEGDAILADQAGESARFVVYYTLLLFYTPKVLHDITDSVAQFHIRVSPDGNTSGSILSKSKSHRAQNVSTPSLSGLRKPPYDQVADTFESAPKAPYPYANVADCFSRKAPLNVAWLDPADFLHASFCNRAYRIVTLRSDCPLWRDSLSEVDSNQRACGAFELFRPITEWFDKNRRPAGHSYPPTSKRGPRYPDFWPADLRHRVRDCMVEMEMYDDRRFFEGINKHGKKYAQWRTDFWEILDIITGKFTYNRTEERWAQISHSIALIQTYQANGYEPHAHKREFVYRLALSAPRKLMAAIAVHWESNKRLQLIDKYAME